MCDMLETHTISYTPTDNQRLADVLSSKRNKTRNPIHDSLFVSGCNMRARFKNPIENMQQWSRIDDNSMSCCLATYVCVMRMPWARVGRDWTKLRNKQIFQLLMSSVYILILLQLNLQWNGGLSLGQETKVFKK